MAERLKNPIFGADSTSQVPLWAAHSSGMHFAFRYLSRSDWKVLKPGEYTSNKVAGIDTAMYFEDEADAALKGYERGKQDALFATQQLQALTGETGPILATVDMDPNVHAFDAFDPYFDGWAAVLTHEQTGPYGGKKVVTRQLDRGFKRAQQTYAWSNNEFDTRAGSIQFSNAHTIAGVDVDFDHAYYEDFGQLGFKPVVEDPNHYDRYDRTTRHNLSPAGLGIHNELACALLYDKYRARQTKLRHPHRQELAILRKQCAWFFGRLREEANVPHNGGWMAFHRGWRGQMFYHRYLGQKVTK